MVAISIPAPSESVLALSAWWKVLAPVAMVLGPVVWQRIKKSRQRNPPITTPVRNPTCRQQPGKDQPKLPF
jgi:hypothetical protein